MVGTSPSNTWGAGSTPGLGVKIPHACDQSQKVKHRQYCNKFNKDLNKTEKEVLILKKKKKDTVVLKYNLALKNPIYFHKKPSGKKKVNT